MDVGTYCWSGAQGIHQSLLYCVKGCSPIERDGTALSRLGVTLWLAWGQVHPYLDWGQLNWGRVIDREG